MPNTPTDTDLDNNGSIITKEFLQQALEREAGKSSVPEILSYTTNLGTKPGDNYTSLIYSVDVEFKDGSQRHLLLKCYPNHLSRQGLNNRTNIFYKELEVYSKWIPELMRLQTEVIGLEKDQLIKLSYASFVDGAAVDFQSTEGLGRIGVEMNSLDNFIMMEDMRKSYGFRTTNRREALDIWHMRLVFEALAKTHALSWAYRNHVEAEITGKFPCFVSNFKDEMAQWRPIIIGNLDQAKEIYDQEFGPGNEYSDAAEGFKRHLDVLEDMFLGEGGGEGMNKLLRVCPPDVGKFGKDSENPVPWRIICHGDCWSNNLMFRYDPDSGKPCEVILVDLQLPVETCVVNDLEYVTYTCTDLELRENHIDELLQLYHDTFNKVCNLLKTPTLPGFSLDSLRYRYHRGKLLGYFVVALGLPIMLKEEDKVVNMEDIGVDENVTNAFLKISSDVGGNSVFKKRLIGVTKGLIDDGVL